MLVTSPRTGKSYEIEWNDPNPPTEEDLSKILDIEEPQQTFTPQVTQNSIPTIDIPTGPLEDFNSFPTYEDYQKLDPDNAYLHASRDIDFKIKSGQLSPEQGEQERQILNQKSKPPDLTDQFNEGLKYFLSGSPLEGIGKELSGMVPDLPKGGFQAIDPSTFEALDIGPEPEAFWKGLIQGVLEEGSKVPAPVDLLTLGLSPVKGLSSVAAALDALSGTFGVTEGMRSISEGEKGIGTFQIGANLAGALSGTPGVSKDINVKGLAKQLDEIMFDRTNLPFGPETGAIRFGSEEPPTFYGAEDIIGQYLPEELNIIPENVIPGKRIPGRDILNKEGGLLKRIPDRIIQETTIPGKNIETQLRELLKEKPGVSEEELEFTNFWEEVKELEKSGKTKITKKELEDILKKNEIRVIENVREDLPEREGNALKNMLKEDIELQERTQKLDDEYYRVAYPDEEGNIKSDIEVDQRRKEINEEVTKLSNRRKELIKLIADVKKNKKTKDPKWSQFVHGGNRLVTLMDEKAKPRHREISFNIPGRNKFSAEGHWDEPESINQLGWIRGQEFIDDEGKKVFLIDEIQSDISIAARRAAEDKGKKGYLFRSKKDDSKILELEDKISLLKEELEVTSEKSNETYGLWNNAQDELDEYISFLAHSKEHNYGMETEIDPKYIELKKKSSDLREEYNRLAGEESRLASNVEDLQDRISELTSGVPQLPLVRESDTFMLKRLTRWASDEGFDKIAWTTGRQQNIRYNRNLSKPEHIKHYDEMIPNVFKKMGVGEQKRLPIPGKYGKPLSDTDPKMIAYKNQLKMHERFNEITKKLDEIDVKYYANESAPGEYSRLVSPLLDERRRLYDLGFFKPPEPPEDPSFNFLHSIDLTPEFKEKVQGGLPLYGVIGKRARKDIGTLGSHSGETRVVYHKGKEHHLTPKQDRLWQEANDRYRTNIKDKDPNVKKEAIRTLNKTRKDILEGTDLPEESGITPDFDKEEFDDFKLVDPEEKVSPKKEEIEDIEDLELVEPYQYPEPKIRGRKPFQGPKPPKPPRAFDPPKPKGPDDKPKTVRDQVLDTLGLWKAIKSIDPPGMTSAVLRQGLLTSAGHPIYAARAFKDSFKTYFSQGHFDKVSRDIDTHPYAPLFKEYVALSDPYGSLVDQEEQFLTRFSKNIPLIKQSERAYITYLNKLRSDVFADGVRTLSASKKHNPTEKELQALGNVINAFTGRGKLPFNMEKIVPELNVVLWSPRFQASRLESAKLSLQALTPQKYGGLPSQARKEALRSIMATAGLIYTTLALAEMNGYEVKKDDPNNSDFLKIKDGNTRYDILGGFQPWMKIVHQTATGEFTSARTGKKYKLAGPTIKGVQRGTKVRGEELTQGGNLLRFGRQKLSPLAGNIADLVEGEEYPTGRKIEKFSDVMTWEDITPMFLSDLQDLYKETGKDIEDINLEDIQDLTIPGALSGMGVGVTTIPRNNKR